MGNGPDRVFHCIPWPCIPESVEREIRHVIKPEKSKYAKVDVSTGEISSELFTEKQTNTKEFWLPVLKDKSFSDFIENKYKIAHGNILQSDINEE